MTFLALFGRDVVLPLTLSLGYVGMEFDGGLEQDLASRRYRAVVPDDEYDSDGY